jgi:hypothetical protein
MYYCNRAAGYFWLGAGVVSLLGLIVDEGPGVRRSGFRPSNTRTNKTAREDE